MGLQHIRRFTPPWVGESGTTFCGRKINPRTRLITVDDCQAALAEAINMGDALPGMPVAAVTNNVSHMSDKVFVMMCRTAEACRPCVKDIPVMRSWETDPVECLAQHAHFMTYQSPEDRAEWRNVVHAISSLVALHPAEFRREKALIALRGGMPG